MTDYTCSQCGRELPPVLFYRPGVGYVPNCDSCRSCGEDDFEDIKREIREAFRKHRHIAIIRAPGIPFRYDKTAGVPKPRRFATVIRFRGTKAWRECITLLGRLSRRLISWPLRSKVRIKYARLCYTIYCWYNKIGR